MSDALAPDYRIFTDATADFPQRMMHGSSGVAVLPMEVAFDNDVFLYGPGGDLAVSQFYAMQRQGRFAATSQINPLVYHAAFEKALQSGMDVLYLGFSSGMSGTLHAARICMEELAQAYPERRLICVDTLGASIGEGLLVREAARKQQAGMTMEELAAWVLENRLKVCHWFTVDGFEHLCHGGRVSAASAAMGSMLKIKPLLHVNNEGVLQVVKKPRGRRRAMTEQIACMQQGWMPEVSPLVVVGHGDDMDAAMLLKHELEARFPQADVQIADIGPIIGAHTGPGMLALTYWGNNR